MGWGFEVVSKCWILDKGVAGIPLIMSSANPPLNLPPLQWGETWPAHGSVAPSFETTVSRQTRCQAIDPIDALPLSNALGRGPGVVLTGRETQFGSLLQDCQRNFEDSLVAVSSFSGPLQVGMLHPPTNLIG